MSSSGDRRTPRGAVARALCTVSLMGLVACVSPAADSGLQASLASAAPALSSAAPSGTAAAGEPPWRGIGRLATAAEIAAWDIDVRADFKGLPKGSGSVDKGMDVWEAKCASCHGTFGESNEVFTPIVGGTSRQDIVAGRVANLARADFPQRTTLMKLSQVSTLWDYINRAMPWNAPKSLTVEEVYAVTAYILHLGDVVPADFVLSDANIAQVQGRLPNRHGMVRYDGLWDVRGRPDVQASVCMRDCPVERGIDSFLPEHARNAHGQLAAQNRVVGPVRGADTLQPAGPQAAAMARAATLASLKTTDSGAAAPSVPPSVSGLAQSGAPGEKDYATLARDTGCLACHALDGKLVGPGLREVALRYQAQPDALAQLSARVRAGSQGRWGPIPMPPQPQLSESDADGLVKWILAGAR
jgi:cytochrome c551/c552